MGLAGAARAAGSLSWSLTWKIFGYPLRVAQRRSAGTRAAAASYIRNYVDKLILPGPEVSRACPPKVGWALKLLLQLLSSLTPVPVLATRCPRRC